jgi:hypothetical protein
MWWRKAPATDEYGRRLLPPGQTYADNQYCPEKDRMSTCSRCGEEILICSGWCPEEHDCQPMTGSPDVFREIVREEIAAALHSSKSDVLK